MPKPPAKPCRNPQCFNLQPCSAHPQKAWGGSRGYERSISGWEWQRRVRQVIERDGGVCQLRLSGCTTTATTADHRIGASEWRRQGLPPEGCEAEGNLQASCANCNEAKRREQARSR